MISEIASDAQPITIYWTSVAPLLPVSVTPGLVSVALEYCEVRSHFILSETVSTVIDACEGLFW